MSTSHRQSRRRLETRQHLVSKYGVGVTERPFHHGNLRAALLGHAVVVLRDSGVDGLSLRDLARRAGVSHGAPRSHFLDRQALLDALAELGFRRLTEEVRHAVGGADDVAGRFRRVAQAYVDFAIEDAALMDLMFQAKTSGRPGSVHDAATALFTVLDAAVGPRPGDRLQESARDVLKMLFSATMQGIAALVVSDRIDRPQAHQLVDAAADMLLGSDLAARIVTKV